MKPTYLIVNFGGPRHLGEVEEFLTELLCDQEVIRTRLPRLWHRLLFTRVAKKRSRQVAPDYERIGGKSPIYEDTEAIAASVGKQLGVPICTFHRYLPKTHPMFIEGIEALQGVDEIRVFPLFPQFSYVTTGSIALWFARHLHKRIVDKMRWIKSYPDHPGYISAFASVIRQYLEQHDLKEEETMLLFSAHGLPKSFVEQGDPYERECQETFCALKEHFPKALSHLCYQSQFGDEEWLRPYTKESAEQVLSLGKGYRYVVFVPLSFTSDHIETLFEIEHLYLPLVQKQGLQAFRCPALNRNEEWIKSITALMVGETIPNLSLLRSKFSFVERIKGMVCN